MYARLAATLGLLSVVALPWGAAAETLYSIDIVNDVLVRIDTESGKAYSFPPSGEGFARPEIVYHGGFFYAVNSHRSCTDGPGGHILTKIDPVTGGGLGSVVLTVGGVPLNSSVVEGLATDGSTLIVALRASGEPCGGAYRLADLSVTGALTNISDPFSATADMNQLVADESGQLHALDYLAGQTDVYEVTRPSTYALQGSHATDPGTIYGGAVFGAKGLWALYRQGTTATLRRIDPANGQVLSSLPLQTTLTLRGLAVGPSPVPANPPAVRALAALVIAGSGALALARAARAA